MLTHSQCEMARQATGTRDPDKEIMEQFDALSDDEKEKVAKDVRAIVEKADSNLGRGLYEISARYFMTQPVIFCVYKEWQAKHKRQIIKIRVFCIHQHFGDETYAR